MLRPRVSLTLGGLLATVALMACQSAEPTPTPSPTATPTATPTPTPAAPALVAFPRDHAAHANLTEWWYYSGHLEDTEGNRYGFHFVVFQRLLGEMQPAFLAQASLTDVARSAHLFDARAAAGPPPGEALPLEMVVGGWSLRLGEGKHRISASLDTIGLALSLQPVKPPVLHNGNGLVCFGEAGCSYYYSQTRMAASGTISMAGQELSVTGLAWMDHQWGDFKTVGTGGWDWFALQMDNGTDIMLSIARDAQGESQLIYGTLVDASGATRHLATEELQVVALGRWRSPRTNAQYPSGWRVRLPDLGLDLSLEPVLVDQEFVMPAVPDLTYWEGKATLTGTQNGEPRTGAAYVELYGYAARAQQETP